MVDKRLQLTVPLISNNALQIPKLNGSCKLLHEIKNEFHFLNIDDNILTRHSLCTFKLVDFISNARCRFIFRVPYKFIFLLFQRFKLLLIFLLAKNSRYARMNAPFGCLPAILQKPAWNASTVVIQNRTAFYAQHFLEFLDTPLHHQNIFAQYQTCS
jgi:hypothetical protein